jgi:hypothetical protein
MPPVVSSPTLQAVRSITLTIVSGACSYVHFSCRDYLKLESVIDLLKEHTAFNATYDSSERESEHASTCQEGTRGGVISNISAWAKRGNDHPICWLEGPAGSGKSTVAHTVVDNMHPSTQKGLDFGRRCSHCIAEVGRQKLMTCSRCQ